LRQFGQYQGADDVRVLADAEAQGRAAEDLSAPPEPMLIVRVSPDDPVELVEERGGFLGHAAISR
jgi:hypothetical protein